MVMMLGDIVMVIFKHKCEDESSVSLMRGDDEGDQIKEAID